MKIFLLGFMGCGKSSLGRKLAKHLGYTFADLDKLIEARAGMSITDYFNEHGEAAFRELERDVLQHTDHGADSVIATGGGAPYYFDNMDWMNRQGQTVYLSLPPKALAGRLEHSKTERPLIKGLKGEELVAFIEDKLAAREPFYKQAKYIISGINLTAEKLAGYLWEGK